MDSEKKRNFARTKKIRYMLKKKSGFPYEVHPTPMKGKDGKNIVYARPARRLRLSIEGLDDYCAKHYSLRSGELELVLKAFLKAAGEMMAMGYRIETPIGSFVPKLKLKREITDADAVCDDDVMLDGVDYNSGKLWDKAIEGWLFNGFRREENPNVQELLNDTALLEEALNKGLKKGYITTKQFAGLSGLTLYSARKQLDAWTQGENPKLMKSRMGQTDIYTAI
jgi:hypothetical protein